MHNTIPVHTINHLQPFHKMDVNMAIGEYCSNSQTIVQRRDLITADTLLAFPAPALHLKEKTSSKLSFWCKVSSRKPF